MDSNDHPPVVMDTGQRYSQNEDDQSEMDFVILSGEEKPDIEESFAQEVRNCNLDESEEDALCETAMETEAASVEALSSSLNKFEDNSCKTNGQIEVTPVATESNSSPNKLDDDKSCSSYKGSSAAKVMNSNPNTVEDTQATPVAEGTNNSLDILKEDISGNENLDIEITSIATSAKEISNCDLAKSENERYDTARDTLIQTLGLISYFPEKISLQDVMMHSSGTLECLNDVSWYVLSKILMLDYRGRDDIISNAIEKSVSGPGRKEDLSDMSEDDFDDIYSLLTDAHQLKDSTTLPHPMDVLVLAFLSSSNFLRQIVCEKLFMCKLSIPLVIPPVYNDKSTLFLWSFRSIALECKLPDGEINEISAAKHHLPVVSCIRLGQISRSKSEFLNEIINGRTHPTFFHRDCPNGMNNRSVSEGLLEIAWYFPSAGQNNFESLNENVAFINLRGDGTSKRASQSKTFLTRVSSLVLVMVDVSELQDLNIQANVEEIASHSSQMLLMVTKKGNGRTSEKDMQGIKLCVEILKSNGYGKDNVIFDFNSNGERNIKVLKKETEDKINKCWKVKSKKTTTIESYKGLAESMNMNVDEQMHECSLGKKMAYEIVQKVCKNGIDNLKAQNLPLQCKPWQEWAQLNTEEHRRDKRGAEDMSSYMDKLATRMRKLRHEQLHLLENPDNVTDVFTEYLLHSVEKNNLYFLKWLKLSLDEISKETLPDLQKKCSSKWNQIRTCEDATKQKHLQKELDECEEKLAESSFGLEHFMREIAQAYEAVHYMGKEISGSIEERTRMLPTIMAKLILLGYPVELMDGDAAHIPLKWVQAVLHQLSQLVGNKKIFVLSVLGIQSSGKSTLLNTMFGLQFSVAAGRCTRGVYAQLVPVPVEYSSTEYDYILVVDTEGLRAAELGNAKLQHDNEIATFVIGLGDVTLVNVKGENVSEMEDVLQIVIHALLKMSLVNRNLKLQPSCIFVHQNVSAPDASQKLRTGQQKFMETLDKVTKAAGKEEDAPQYTKFKQLIDFDINTNIWYISDLWRGDPPMAPANPGYSENVNKVKHMLLMRVMQNRSLKLTVNKFSTRLKDLWNGILEQNFVFSFKNSLELDAYNSLEKELSNALWPLKEEATKCLNTAKNKLENRNEDLNKLGVLLTNECKNALDKKYNEAQGKLEEFFATDDDKSLLEQWRASTFLRLQAIYGDVVERTIDNLKCEIAKKKIKVDQKEDMQIYISKIMDEAKKVAEDLRLHDNEEIASEEELNRRFREKWDDWMQMLPQTVRDDISVEDKINDVLEKTFRYELPLLNKAREKRCREIIHHHFSYAIEKYVIDVKSYTTYVREMTLKVKTIAMSDMEKLLSNIDQEFRQTMDQVCICIDHARKIIAMVSNTVVEMKKKLKVRDENRFELYMALFVSQYVSGRYSRRYSFEIICAKNYELTKFGIHPIFENVLLQKYTPTIQHVKKEIKSYLQQQTPAKNFPVDLKEHIHSPQGKKGITNDAQKCVDDLFDEVHSYIKGNEIQCFREEYIDEIIRKISTLEIQEKRIQFTKTFRIDLAVYLCQFTVLILCEKQERYIEDMDQRFVYERDNYKPCLENFKNFYYRATGEQAVANVLSERLTNAIEIAVDKDMAMVLAKDVRHNVTALSGKPAFLKAILRSLLDENKFDEFFLYFNDTDACFEKWLTHYVNAYLFSSGTSGQNQYSKLAFQRIGSLVSKVCQKIEPFPCISEVNSKEVIKKWIELFCKELEDMLPLPCEDLLSLAAGYDILSLETFTSYLKLALQKKEENVKREFENHSPEHQKNHNENVYTIIGEECKGCTEKCPFCSVPCYLNTYGHTESGKKHMALEHYPQACGRYRYLWNQKLVIDNCSVLVAGEYLFICKDTDSNGHPYKRYQEKYPDWEIHGDPSVEETPYWKWFLMNHAQQLADRYNAKMPDIPSSWNSITKDKALNTLK